MREKLIELLVNLTDRLGCQLVGYSLAMKIADRLIANGVTIPVRCKDCRKRYNPKECPMCVRVYGEQHDVTNDDGYCDYGERRTDA